MDRSYFSRISLVAVLASLPLGCSQKAQPIAQPVQEMSSPQPTSDLERQLNDAMAASARDKDRIAALESEAAALRQKLAQRPQPTAAPAPGWSSVPGGAMTSIEGTILFDAGKAALKPDAKNTLASVVSVVQSKFPGYDIYVFGHTDDTPIKKSGWKDNYELSAQRALSVVRMLRSMDVENKMAAAGWGEQLPAEAGSTSAARQQNRRVEIYAMAPAKGGRAEIPPPSGAGRGGRAAGARPGRPGSDAPRTAAGKVTRRSGPGTLVKKLRTFELRTGSGSNSNQAARSSKSRVAQFIRRGGARAAHRTW